MKRIVLAVLFFTSSIAMAQAPAPDLVQLQQRLDRTLKILQDWPQLSRYADANAKLAAPQKKEKRVVFMGDSITDMWKLEEYFPGKPYVNRGISGQTTPQMLVRMRPDVIALKPRAVLILAGTNDIAGNTGPMTLEQIQDNYRSMAELARANKINVIFASVLPVSDYGPRPMTDRRSPEKILALNKWLKEYCAANKCVYLDYFSAVVDQKGFLRADLANDGLHPNAAGYNIMAPFVEAAISKAVK